MFIDGIKVIPSDGSEPKVWRFKNVQGAFKHLSVLQSERSEQEIIKASIGFAVFGIRSPSVRHALVALTDDNGDAWVFERSDEQLRCLKNRQLVDMRDDQHLKTLFADFLPFEGPPSWPQLIKTLELGFDGQSLRADGGRNLRKGPWDILSQERNAELRQKLAQIWTKCEGIDWRQMAKFLPAGEGCHRRWQALQDHARDVGKVFHQLEQVDLGLLKRFEQELEIIKQIRNLAEPMMVPARNPKVLQERLTEVDAEIQDIGKQLQPKQLPVPEHEVDWSMVLQGLTRFQACDRLEKAARSSLQEAREQLRPVFETYRQQIISFLDHDRELIHGFEICLQELDGLMQKSGSRQRPNLSHKLNKLLGFQPGEGQALDAEEGLDKARRIVNHCLGQIAKLYADLESNGSTHSQKLSDFEARYEQIAKEYAKAREQWLAIAKDSQIDPDISLRQLLSELGLHSRLATLQQKRARLQEDIGEHRSQLRQLAAALESWRTHTGSQKSLSLENPGVVLAEARGVLAYAEKKESQWRKLKALEGQLEAYEQIKGRILADGNRLDELWQKALEETGMPFRALSHQGWDECFTVMREIVLLANLLEQAYRPLEAGKIFSEAVFDVPFVLFSWKEAQASNKARLSLLQEIEHANPYGWAMILCEDQTLVDMMQKMGLSVGQKLNLKTAEKDKTPVAQRVEPQKPLISDKARSALEIFAAKQGGPKRGEL